MANTPTNNFGYNKPAFGDTGWHTTTNGNWDAVDTDFAAEHRADTGNHGKHGPKVTIEQTGSDNALTISSSAAGSDVVTISNTGSGWDLKGSAGLWGATKEGVIACTGITGVSIGGGATGIQGVTGIQGITGSQGIQGETGVQGAQGEIGIQGVTGSQGVAGETGLQGETGLGIAGSQGATGIQGITGAGGNTLDQAYDQGGAGAGRTITVDSGAVYLNAAANNVVLQLDQSSTSATNTVLQVNNSGTGYGIQVGGALHVTSSAQIDSNLSVDGSATISGKLTVTGGVDPDYMQLTPQLGYKLLDIPKSSLYIDAKDNRPYLLDEELRVYRIILEDEYNALISRIEALEARLA